MNTNFKPHPDGIKSYIGHDRLTGLYSVRIGWTIYAANANGSVLYTVKGEVKTPLNVEEFKSKRPKVYATLMNEISFQRKKALAIALQLNNIPSYDRKSHKRRMGMVGSR
ncbi:hypothetical protein [Acinetobacter baumannii]|uniref:hypothetical protein n=1 Tax=Acinetobacter baumannii TaxID=470 RepID=UPI00123A2EE2|nr:hypothetical protein [Acinetobacter baumannii]MDC4574380.1 hypothetical protein [Acinetobacter baumannii]MDR9562793.1 hypothetical protein [Acinetobacter baumannii]QER76126.1 hypothetical protein F3P16_13575 [Acinetobacter baumannii]HEO1818182.1 hypothetical protein [Acinetobacter baumannii]